MTNRVGRHEWEALSAYLDNQLSPKDRGRLETRLKGDAELRQALEELRRTRIILRSQRPLRAPRNFTLTTAMAGVRRGRSRSNSGSFTVLRLASALATIFFILITVGDLVVQNYGPQPRTVSSVEQPAAGPMFGMGGGGGGGPAIMPLAPTPAPEIGAAAVAEASAEASAVAPDARSLPVTPLGTSAATVEAMKQADQPPAALLQPGANPVELQRENVAGAQPAARPPGATLVIRLLQVLLVMLAIGAGLAAYYVRRTAG